MMSEADKPPEEKPEEASAAEGEVPKEEATQAPPKPPRKPLPMWAGCGLMLVFLGLAVGLGYVMWLLNTTYHLINDEGYFEQFRGGRVVARQNFEDALGWNSEFLIDKKPDKPARIRFLLRDNERKPITDASVDIVLIRPDDAKALPVTALLKMVEPGVYRGDVDMPQGGLWEAKIRVKEGGNAYQVTQRLTLPENKKDEKK